MGDQQQVDVMVDVDELRRHTRMLHGGGVGYSGRDAWMEEFDVGRRTDDGVVKVRDGHLLRAGSARNSADNILHQ